MVALLKTKPRERRTYDCGPTSIDVPLRVYEPPPKQVPWWIDIALAAGFVVVMLVDLAALVSALALGGW